MRNQLTNPRGNIILLALFVLFASSLIGLLISMMMRGFLRYSEDIASYQKASYLAKAGAEVGFLLTNTTKANFDYTLEEDKKNILNNFTCKREKEENGICPDFNLNLQIIGLGNTLNNCSNNNRITLNGGQSIIIPAFYANGIKLGGNGTLKQVALPTIEGDNKGDSNKLKKTIATYDKNNTLTLKEGEEWEKWKRENSNTNTNSYFILSNTSKDTVQICPFGENIPQENIKILSTATFRDKTIGKEYLSTQKLPDFLKSDNYLKTEQNN